MSAGPCPPWRSWSQACRLLMCGVTARAATPVALVVGTVLSAVNEGGQIASGELDWVVGVRVAVNYATPFVVASVGYLASGRTGRRPGPSDRQR